MEHTQSRENREGNSSSRDNDQSQKGRWHDGGGGQRHDRDVGWQPTRNGGGKGYGRGRGRFNRPYSGNVRDGFDHPYYPNTDTRNQEYVEGNDNSNRSRPHDKHSEDHMRDSSPERNDRARHTDKQYEDHARDQSPDRSSNEQYQYIQGAECGTNNKSMNWNQSQHYQGNCGKSDQGYQQGYDNQFDGKQDYYNYTGSQGQGGYGAYGNQQSSNLNYKHNKNWNQQEPYGYLDDSKHEEFPKDRRPRNRFSEDHMRDPSPDRNDRVRHKDKQNGDHARELSPDRSSNEQYTQSKHYQGNSGNSEQVYQQGYDNQYDGKQDYYSDSQGQGRYGAYGNQQSSNWNYNHNKYWNQQDGNKQKEFQKDRRPKNRVENLDFKPLLSHVEATLVIHGTYFNSWEKIRLTGLSRMGRNHIHFAAGKPGENGVISEIRSSCEVMIYINLQKALEGGLKFFWSANNVILSPGNEDGVIPPAYFEAVVLRNPSTTTLQKSLQYEQQGQRLDFDQNVTITGVPVGGESLAHQNVTITRVAVEGESLAQGKSKKKKKGKGGDEDKGEGKENKSKKEKNEIYDSALEDTGSLFNEEKIEVQEEDAQRVVEKMEEKIEVEEENVEQMEVTEQKAPAKWDEDEDYEDAVQDYNDDFHDAEDGSDVIDEPIVIEDAPASVSAIGYLKGQEVVAVYCDQLEDTFSKIVCAVSDKFYIFDIQKTPDIMSKGKLAEFFSTGNSQEPWKVFHGLTSRICATFFEKFEIILEGTKIFDLKMAYDIMNTQGLGNMTKLKQTRYDPKSVPTSLESCDVMAYLKGFQYLDKVMKNETKDYKKQLFKMVKADICNEQMKKLRDQRKKELKKPSIQEQAPSKNKPEKKRKKKLLLKINNIYPWQ